MILFCKIKIYERQFFFGYNAKKIMKNINNTYICECNCKILFCLKDFFKKNNQVFFEFADTFITLARS